ncbi:MAG: bifunctional 5,10-methylenetetrahydrofolate dehydrogenase/5,10-methenyltetrahydrofolate cyclohydrolase [Thermoplasmatales archaeon]|nr:bifunctional 5,10-methylenetetrahydrofolate dehydrogenase/5,10-methenyltetrahydrofolate cyclohydrolase [Thermoplasmatales archaeon]
MRVIDGKALAKKIEEKIKEKIKEKVKDKEIKIVTFVIGNNEESLLFANLKDNACKRVGIDHEIIGFDFIKQDDFEKEIEKLNKDGRVSGINIQLPLPPKLDYNKLISKIDYRKDIEGMHPLNIGKIILGEEDILPSTPKAILKIIENEKILLKGKNVVIVNHSKIIGKPLAILLLNRDATVSVCHVYTDDLKKYTRKADLLITATGVKGLIKEEHIKEDCIIIDAGIKKENGKIYGDVDEGAAKKAIAFTPVPGGVGPVTIACMLENAVIAYEKIHK